VRWEAAKAKAAKVAKAKAEKENTQLADNEMKRGKRGKAAVGEKSRTANVAQIKLNSEQRIVMRLMSH